LIYKLLWAGQTERETGFSEIRVHGPFPDYSTAK